MASKDALEQAAIKAVANKQNHKAEKELKDFIQETYKIDDKREIAFILQFIKTGKSYKSYQAVYGEHITMGSAAVLANRILNKAKFKIADFLDNSGHSIGEMMEVLETLKNDDPKEYIKYMLKLRGLDKQNIELSGEVSVPIINIVTQHKD